MPGQEGVGHTQIHGGGALSTFGEDFRRAGYRWTIDLCRTDSDLDGESNGLELGDPCCEWKEGAQPRRPWRLSSPGIDRQPTHCCADVVATTGMAMPNCSELVHEPILDITGAKAVQNFVDANDHFWEFYFTNVGAKSQAPQDTSTQLWSGASFLIHGGQNVASLLLGAELCILFLFKRKVHDKKVWGNNADAQSSRIAYHIILFVCAVLYTDLISGLLHIVLDNPLFNEWPGIGQAAISFQHHHHDPAGVTRGRYFDFCREHHVGLALLVALCFLFPRNARGSATLYAFFFYIVPLTSLMMASHRWSHTPPPRLPYGVAFLQRWGVLMTQRHHSLHHVGYKINFAIFTGWSNALLNYVTANWLAATKEAWVWILAGWCLLPLCGCWVQLLLRSRNKYVRNQRSICFLPLSAKDEPEEYGALNKTS